MTKKQAQEIEELDLGELNEIKIDNKRYSQMWNDLIQVDGFVDYLKETMALDVKRVFLSQPQAHDRIHGHYDFANYLVSVIKYLNEQKSKKAVDKE